MNDPNTLQIVFHFFHWYLATFIKVSRKIKTCAIALEKEMSTNSIIKCMRPDSGHLLPKNTQNCQIICEHS